MSAEVPIRLVDDIHGENKGRPGAAKWWSTSTGKSQGLHFWCPCGCGALLGVNVKTADGRGSGWDWNFSRDRPTLQPSILHMDGCRWHGFLTDGVFRSC